DFGDMIVSPCYIPQIVYSTTFGYRTDLVKEAPTSINDVFDLEKIPGKRSLEKKPINNLEWALIADGVSPDEVYDVLETEEGVDRALAKLDTIKDSVIWWDKGAQTPQLLADGEVVIGSTYNGRLFSVIEEEKQPIAMMWDWQVFDLDGWVVPKGAPHREEVAKYLTFATDTQRLADQAKFISYGPARASSAPLVGKHADLGIEMSPHMPTAPENAKNTLLYNYEFWADNRDDLTERFNSWLAQ
ncbi:MAG: extracellular solute-binding protein, partial [Gammaproteobacteria bacterium]|nr:extracellular solute-binding protein [Gammaproteobacteria bacterium]